MQAVLDRNIVVSAAISPKGPPAEILRAWRSGAFTWVSSPPLLAELERTLRSPRLRKYVNWSAAEAAEFLSLLRQSARIVEPGVAIDVISADPSDNRVLEAAAEAGADYIVSGDSDLLQLRSYEDIAIVPATRFVAIIVAGL